MVEQGEERGSEGEKLMRGEEERILEFTAADPSNDDWRVRAFDGGVSDGVSEGFRGAVRLLRGELTMLRGWLREMTVPGGG